MHRAIYLFLFTSLLLGCSSFTKAQGKLTMLDAMGSEKVSSHEDTPDQCWGFAWVDSTGWDSTEMSTFTYFINGNVQEELKSQYVSNAFALTERRTYAYTPDGKLEDLWVFQRNGIVWDSSIHDHYIYDTLGNQTIFLERIWNGNYWDIVAGERSDYTYRNIDQFESKVGWQWQQSGQLWLLVDSIHYNYNLANVRTSDVHFGYSGVGWAPSFQWIDYQWHNFNRLEPSYGLRQRFNAGWEDEQRFHATFGNFGSVEAVYESYVSSVWDTSYKVVATYDAQDHVTVNEYYAWQSGWQLALGQSNAYTYDSLGNTLERIQQSYNGTGYVNEIRYVYGSFFVGAADPILPNFAVQVYPNPMVEELHFDLNLTKSTAVQVQLWDMQGRLWMQSSAHLQAGSELVMPIAASLQNGTYIYRIITAQGQASGKVILAR